MDNQAEETGAVITPQQTYDTLLVVGWKKEWLFNRLAGELFARGIDPMTVDRRAFQDQYRGRIPVRAAIHQTCPLMSDHLWRCKNFKDFLTVRDNLWAGMYTFRGDTNMISNSDRKKDKRARIKMGADIDMQESVMNGSRKLGGCAASRHNAGLKSK